MDALPSIPLPWASGSPSECGDWAWKASRAFHTQSLFVNSEGRAALACPYQRGAVHRAFTFELVAWLLEVGSGNSPEGLVSHAELDPTSKRWAETSWYNDFRYEISVSFQRLCFFFCHHICQSPLNIPSLFLFFKNLKWPWRES